MGQSDGGVAIWKLDSSGFGKPKHSQLLWGHKGEEVTRLAFHRDGDILATAAKCGEILIKRQKTFREESLSSISTSFSGAEGSLVNIWCLRSCSVLQTVKSEERTGILSLEWLDRNDLAVCYARSTVSFNRSGQLTLTVPWTNGSAYPLFNIHQIFRL